MKFYVVGGVKIVIFLGRSNLLALFTKNVITLQRQKIEWPFYGVIFLKRMVLSIIKISSIVNGKLCTYGKAHLYFNEDQGHEGKDL